MATLEGVFIASSWLHPTASLISLFLLHVFAVTRSNQCNRAHFHTVTPQRHSWCCCNVFVLYGPKSRREHRQGVYCRIVEVRWARGRQVWVVDGHRGRGRINTREHYSENYWAARELFPQNLVEQFGDHHLCSGWSRPLLVCGSRTSHCLHIMLIFSFAVLLWVSC